MCKTAFYVHPVCCCRWLAVVRPCAPGMGFSTCSTFRTGKAQPAPPTYRAVGTAAGTTAVSGTTKKLSKRHHGVAATATTGAAAAAAPAVILPCPAHDLRGCYDRNSIRQIVDVKNGLRWGTGPDRTDCGVECRCCVM
ncbi:hypothetical protein SPI_07613 [Niveomyces insectorum RCEF 264]|uniref:Uncharacterized protein n=1 Tax=Niveomyces insectorum RCEF 264 TaxID=1081102 RepID=A0A167PFH6_9HYPO|nr:hypothetical protein SPI_07613 [Niveomyces insectorum RCEF 264]